MGGSELARVRSLLLQALVHLLKGRGVAALAGSARVAFGCPASSRSGERLVRAVHASAHRPPPDLREGAQGVTGDDRWSAAFAIARECRVTLDELPGDP
ncbi:MAG: hypothetical protein JOZ42_09140 [Acetobacteraceae bacterium]|nr:hypothetical protein [Acetobacteraceae bacterium]